jgi:hypothetical protein
MTVEIVRTFGEPPTIERVVERSPDGAVHEHRLGPLRLGVGTTFTVEAAGPGERRNA